MRVVDFASFALAFLVDSIVCAHNGQTMADQPRQIALPNLPYRVSRMEKNALPQGVMVYYTSATREPDLSNLQKISDTLYPVQSYLYVVKHNGRIIGHVRQNKDFQALTRRVGNEYSHISINSRGQPEEMDNNEYERIGFGGKVPENTIFPRGGMRESDVIIIRTASGGFAGVMIDGHFHPN